MARDERSGTTPQPATRNYVIFGLLFVVAIGLALWDWLDPHERRGETDNALRLLVVTSSEHAPIPELTGVDGLNVAQIGPDEAIAYGRDLLDDAEAPAYRAATAYADEHGYGFVALDLDGDWALSEAPPPSARYAVFSVGDVATEGPRMHSVGLPGGVELDPRLAELDSLRLGLYDHPDLTRLWTIEQSAAEAQARKVLDGRQLDERRELIKADHAAWAAIEASWPGHPEAVEAPVPHSLAGPWERVAAAPIPGGLLLAVHRVRAATSVYRTVSLERDERAALLFLPESALREGGDLIGAREPCSGLPVELTNEIAVAPDGSAVVIGEGSGTATSGPGGPAQAELFVFEHDPATEPGCRARRVGVLPLGDRAVGRAHASGGMAWNYDDDWLHWWDEAGAHQVRVAGVSASSGPWWVDARLLAMVGERSLTLDPNEAAGPELVALDYEPVVVLLSTTATDDQERARVELGTRELFGELLPDAPLVDLRPAGPRDLVITTERCPGEHAYDPNPCLHRIRGSAPLTELMPELAAGTQPIAELLSVESLGSIAPHVELAVASDGSRVAWIDRKQRHLWTAALGGPYHMIPRLLEADEPRESSLRISADGRVVLSEISIDLATAELELGSVVVARAFTLGE